MKNNFLCNISLKLLHQRDTFSSISTVCVFRGFRHLPSKLLKLNFERHL